MPTKSKKTPAAKTAPAKTFSVRSTSALVKIMERPDPNSRVVARLVEHRGGRRTFTISEEKGGYGRLSNGIGWIDLRNTENI